MGDYWKEQRNGSTKAARRGRTFPKTFVLSHPAISLIASPSHPGEPSPCSWEAAASRGASRGFGEQSRAGMDLPWHSWSGEGAVPACLSHLGLNTTAYEQAKTFSHLANNKLSYKLQWSVEWGGKGRLHNRLLTSLHQGHRWDGEKGDISLGYSSSA